MKQLVARKLGSVLLLLLAACGGGAASKPPSTAPEPDVHPLAALAASGAILTPAYALRVAPEASSIVQAPSQRDVLRALDEDIGAAIAERGLKTGWIMPADLVLSYKRNPTYAPDPYALAVEPLRSAGFIPAVRLPEPLASQLRMIIALHENARAVLLPIELHLERGDAGASGAKATLKLALVDPRFSEAKWVGTVRSDTTSADVRVLTRSIARGVADLITSR
jgi:hypothetical protein